VHTTHEALVVRCLLELSINLKRTPDSMCEMHWYSAHDFIGYNFYFHKHAKDILGIVKIYDITRTPLHVWEKVWTTLGST